MFLLTTSHQGLFPCGEGAGYAGGITSAAVDGIRVAMSLLKKEKNFEIPSTKSKNPAALDAAASPWFDPKNDED